MPILSPANTVPAPIRPAGTLSLADVVGRLRDMTVELTEFGQREERQFLHIGAQLSNFYTRAREVAAQSEQAISELMQDEGGGALHDLRALLDALEGDVDGVVSEAHHHSESLTRLITQLELIEQPLQSLAKVVKVLQALSFSTRVESTHGQGAQTLQVLADNLKDLATKINNKTDESRERLRAMVDLSSKARERMQRLEGESLLRARTTLQQSRHLLTLLAERRQQALDGANTVKRHSLDITAAIGEVVSSIQFHDITRQQVEHVRIALEDICSECSRREARDIPRQAVVDVCRVQAAQLRHTRSDLVAAVVRIITNLNDISQSVANLSRQTRIVSGAAETEGTTFFKEIEPVILSVTTMLQQSAADNRGALDSVAAVLNAMGELSLLLEQIELIGTEMKLIAFNAGITAAHNMERGAGLGVIANSIQTLSGLVLARTQEFSDCYHQMDRLIRELTDGSSTVIAGERGRSIDDQNRNAVLLIERLREMNRTLVALLKEMDSRSAALGYDIQQVADGVTIHVDAAQVIDDLVGSLESFSSELQPGISGATADGQAMLRRLSERYTMQSEREIHQRASGAVTRNSGRGPRRDQGGKPGGSELGTNVELF